MKIPTESPQPARGAVSRARKTAAKPKATGRVVGVETRAATRGDGEVIELDLGIAVYPSRDKGGRWRAVWHEDGERQQCESVSEDKIAAKLEQVRQRLTTGAANMTRPGADLIAWYLNPDRLPVASRWSRRHADTQRRLCQRFAARSSGRSPARTLRAATRRRRSTPPLPPAKATGSTGCCHGRRRRESSLWVHPSEIPSSETAATKIPDRVKLSHASELTRPAVRGRLRVYLITVAAIRVRYRTASGAQPLRVQRVVRRNVVNGAITGICHGCCQRGASHW